MRIYDDVTKLVGNTPIVKLTKLEEQENLKAAIYAKLEYFNPTGSIKDRPALNMIVEAEKAGLLQKGGTIIEPTSGNTGIGIAAIGRRLGYEVVIVMPENMSEERKKIIKAYGAKLVLSPADQGMKGAIAVAEETARKTGGIILGQFTNPNNSLAHIKTAHEILDDMDGDVDIVVAGVGTGGTVTGLGETLKSVKPEIKVFAVEPTTSCVLSGGNAGKHGIQGIGAGFIPDILNKSAYDEVITVSTEDAYDLLYKIAGSEGLLLGISSGAAVAAAVELAGKAENEGKNIVVICPDTGLRYLSLLDKNTENVK
ncbi:MAG: cysteine synthase A [Clostridiales bacterium]|nr:cysteine synthase A [Clostridiales bacterium]